MLPAVIPRGEKVVLNISIEYEKFFLTLYGVVINFVVESAF